MYFFPLSYVSVEITCFSNLNILMAVEIKQCPYFKFLCPVVIICTVHRYQKCHL